MTKRRLIRFGHDRPAPKGAVREALGLKGVGLCAMAELGLPVPAGVIVPAGDAIAPPELLALVKHVGKGFGSAEAPLLLAVRPSPPGLALGYGEAILNVGLNDQTVEGLARRLGDEPRAYGLYAQFIADYAVLVLGLGHEAFDDLATALDDAEIWSARQRAARYLAFVESQAPNGFPQDVMEQLHAVLAASAPSARIVQVMIYADMAHGRAVSRHPSSGTSGPVIDALLEGRYPAAAKQLHVMLIRLERHFKAAQQVSYAIVDGKLWLLETFPAKTTAKTELKLLVDLVHEGVLSRDEALLRVEPQMLDQFLHPTLDAGPGQEVFATGIAASPGAVSGQLVFDAGEAQQLKARGRAVILARTETSPEDIQAMHVAEGVITARGGLLSHAAVIARGMGKPCVVGASSLRIDYAANTVTANGITVSKGDVITIDGSSGRIYRGAVPTLKPVLSGDFATILDWADQVRRMKVRANAETPHDARAARYFGAEGIGLCRTEHMFFSAERIGAMRRMILAETADVRRAALDEILPMQRKDFIELFEIMAGLPVTIRLLDPPLHEFLPKSEHEIGELAQELGIAPDYLRTRVSELQEFNPMLGHRGVRLAVSYPEIAEMQARAIFEATVIVGRKYGKAPIPEIMIPLVIGKPELDLVRQAIVAVADDVQRESGFDLPYLVGTMIELPRAALRAGEIAQSAEFFSFGTNDLTQTTLGISRDDSARFIGEYTRKGLLAADPFVTLDIAGVGELLRTAADRGRKARPDLKLGICGEHAGDPASIDFCERIKLDYVSCSPFRIAVARLAAAQASLRNL
jgi:pyruvate,orthophosphate dikinase